MLPNFLIIGAAKSGTTSLYNYLRQHPQIYMSYIKEPNFFAYPPNNNWNSINTPDIHWLKENPKLGIRNLVHYEALFEKIRDEVAFGEASVIYLHSYYAPIRIYHHIPKVKLIAILRHPADRAYSNYLHNVRDGKHKSSDFAEALAKEANPILFGKTRQLVYQYQGFYYQHLQRYFQQFSKEQIRVYLYEDLQKNIQQLLKSIFEFIEVEASFIPDTSIRHQSTGFPKNRVLQNIIEGSKPIRDLIRPLIPEKWRDIVYFSIQNRNLTKPSLSPEIRAQLIQVYQEDILNLQDLIQRDLSHWLV